MPGGFNLDFHLEQASVTADSEQMVEELSSSRCGIGRWRVGVAQDLTLAGGCSDIGLAVPSLSLELIKLEISQGGGMALYLGQPSTDRTGRVNSERLYNGDRSTSYQPRMVRCMDTMVGEEEVEVTDPLMLVQSASHSDSDSDKWTDSLIVWLGLIVSIYTVRDK